MVKNDSRIKRYTIILLLFSVGLFPPVIYSMETKELEQLYVDADDPNFLRLQGKLQQLTPLEEPVGLSEHINTSSIEKITLQDT